MSAEMVRFTGARGVELRGRLHRPAGAPRGWALFAHCFTCNKDLRAVRAISQSLAARGFGVLRFDFSGLGQSEGATFVARKTVTARPYHRLAR